MTQKLILLAVLFVLLVAHGSVAGETAAVPSPAVEIATGTPAPPPAEATPAPIIGDYQLPVAPEPPNVLVLVARVLGALSLVTGLLIVGVFLMKRFLSGTRLPSGQKRHIRMIEATSLGGKRFIYLVKAVDRLLVIGASGDQIERLAEITDPALIKTVEAEADPANFKGLLQRMLPGKIDSAGMRKE